MTAVEALERLQQGNERFVDAALEHPRRDAARRTEQAQGQTPFAVVLGCADSRVPPEIVFDQGIGDLFVIRVAGNTAADDITLGSIEFGVRGLGCPLVVVLGHERCGAVTAAVDPASASGHVAALLPPIVPAVEAARATQPDDLVHAAVRENVRTHVARLSDLFPDVAVVGAYFALAAGTVELLR